MGPQGKCASYPSETTKSQVGGILLSTRTSPGNSRTRLRATNIPTTFQTLRGATPSSEFCSKAAGHGCKFPVPCWSQYSTNYWCFQQIRCKSGHGTGIQLRDCAFLPLPTSSTTKIQAPQENLAHCKAVTHRDCPPCTASPPRAAPCCRWYKFTAVQKSNCTFVAGKKKNPSRTLTLRSLSLKAFEP